MGRQTAVALSEDDERAFLSFLRADADIRIYRWTASTPELLAVSAFPSQTSREHSFRLWNTAFGWAPEYDQWPHNVALDSEPHFRLKNVAGAPLLEYSRHTFENPNPLTFGRIYWNTDFAIYRGPAYDAVAFSRWYDRVVRWLRKNGNRVEITKGWCQYWLPGAWAKRCDSIPS